MNESDMLIGGIYGEDFTPPTTGLLNKISSTLVDKETVFGSDEKTAQTKAFHAMIDESNEHFNSVNAFVDALGKPQSAFDTQIGGGHYKSMKIQPTEFIVANNIGFLEGNCIKYICRYKMKNGLEDLKKAKHYLEMMIEIEETKND